MNGTNQQNIIKRLELIKSLISLEEEIEITEQVIKLEKLTTNEDVKAILTHLFNKAYSEAIIAIDDFINQYSQIDLYIDPEIEAIRFEAKTLEVQIQQLSDEKVELEKLIHEFGIRHNKELGAIIIKILKYRKEEYKGTPQEEETQKDYDEFNSNYEASKEKVVTILTEVEQKELKEKYRKASKLCHPDMVTEEQKEEAHQIFAELNAAYERNDLKRVNEILTDLLQNRKFVSKVDTANEKEILKNELQRLRKKIQELINDITTIKTSEAFEIIINIEDWDKYFEHTKQELQNQLNRLEVGAK